MAKMVPMETRQSMLEEPSKGSKHTMYLPWKGRESVKNINQYDISCVTQQNTLYESRNSNSATKCLHGEPWTVPDSDSITWLVKVSIWN